MDLDNEFYKQWKAKSTTNHRFFTEKGDFSQGKFVEIDRIFSSTALEETETESFSLRLTESYVEDTQESLDSKPKQVQINETIMISDSSTDDSLLYDKSRELMNENNVNYKRRQGIYVHESSDDESPKALMDHTTVKKIETLLTTSKPGAKLNDRQNIIIEESDSELEESRVPQILRETVAESATLSDRKKKEIMQWLSTNLDGSRCGSSCSQDTIPESRKSEISSGNSSLERLEMNFETPNNRGKLSKPTTAEKSARKIQKEAERQSTLDQYFKKTRKPQLDIVRDGTPGSKKSDKTPVNNNIRKQIIPQSDSFNSKTPRSTNSNKTPTNGGVLSRRVIIPETESSNSKTPRSTNSDKTLSNRAIPRRIVIPETDTSTSRTPTNSTNSDRALSNKTNAKRIIIPETESSTSKTPRSTNSDRALSAIPRRLVTDKASPSTKSPKSTISEETPVNIRNNRKNVIIPESESFESNDHQDKFKKLQTNSKSNTPVGNPKLQQKAGIVVKPLSLDITDDVDPVDTSPKCLKNTDNKKKPSPLEDTEINNILDDLYGATWRKKANIIVPATEPAKQRTKKIIKDAQTEKRITFRKPMFESESESELTEIENGRNIEKKRSQTTTKKLKNRNQPKNSFINDDSTTESSPDCSYYTALTNPAPSQNNQFRPGTAPTLKASEKDYGKKIQSVCDSESDFDDIWKSRNINQRKLSFASSSNSGTSEFDPEDIVPPKTVTKSVKKTLNFEPPVKTKVIQQLAKQIAQKSFLASLSKDVSTEHADPKAIPYKVNYNTTKEELCKFLFKLFNEKVFDSKLPRDMPIEWSVRLRGTAGKCYNKQSLKTLGNTVRSSRIVLATKILDSPDRLRDTLIHELCHAATWLINNVSDGHGNFWKAWANKATTVFPDLPPISRCHNYEIQTKYTYKCTTCGYSVGRHSKSLDLNKKRCGYCHGMFELLINKVTKAGKVQKKTSTKEPSGFALYVKENYHVVKQSGAGKHGEIMKILGQQFSAVKITPKPGDCIRNNEEESR